MLYKNCAQSEPDYAHAAQKKFSAAWDLRLLGEFVP